MVEFDVVGALAGTRKNTPTTTKAQVADLGFH
jgi:hypothetical protein